MESYKHNIFIKKKKVLLENLFNRLFLNCFSFEFLHFLLGRNYKVNLKL